MKQTVSRYILENNSTVEVHKVFGNRYYFAIVDLNGNYPEKNKVAHDINRCEYIYVIEGKITIKINDRDHDLESGENILVKENDKYSAKGKGKILVFVKDRKGGESKVE